MGYEDIQILAHERTKIRERLKYLKTEKTIQELREREKEIEREIETLMKKRA